MATLSFAVCGLGRIGKRHATILKEYEPTKLNAVIDPAPTARDTFLDADLDETAFYEDLKTFIQSDQGETDVVTIAAPNGLHAPLAIQALRGGYHVVIEKPMALSRQECEQVINTALQVGKQVFVVKQNRYSPTSRWLKKIVDEGIIGEIYSVQINCYWNRDDRYYKPGDWHGTLELDGGTLFTQFSHFVDIMYWVFGDITNISARLNNFNHQEMIEFEDSGMVHFDFLNGGTGCINYSTSCWGQNMESSITVVGSKGSAKVGGQYMNEVEYCHIEDYEMPELEPTNPPNDYGPYKGSAANHHFVFENVVDTLNGKGTITANALEGMKVVEIIENIYSYRRLDTMKVTEK
ncbi:MAG: Gfo/Idh/MocA family protein [Bacteroidota bacterium]